MRTTAELDEATVGLVTLQFHVGGLFDCEPVDDVAHLVRSADRGTPGPTLCGIDRFAKGSAGWSVGGGVQHLNRAPDPCRQCDEYRREHFPGLPIGGMFAISFLTR